MGSDPSGLCGAAVLATSWHDCSWAHGAGQRSRRAAMAISSHSRLDTIRTGRYSPPLHLTPLGGGIMKRTSFALLGLMLALPGCCCPDGGFCGAGRAPYAASTAGAPVESVDSFAKKE